MMLIDLGNKEANISNHDWPDSSFLVVDVHPIHLFLNTESMSRYEASRLHHGNPMSLVSFRNEAKGTYDAFNNLLARIISKA